MKKKLFLMALMSMFAVAVVTSCSKDNDEDDNGGTYTPPANLTQSEIVALLSNAFDATSNANELTVTTKGAMEDWSETLDGSPIITVTKISEVFSFSRSAKKMLQTRYYYDNASSTEKVDYFHYVENFTKYIADGGYNHGHHNSQLNQKSHNVTDAYWNISHLQPYSFDYSALLDHCNGWTVVGNGFAGTYTSLEPGSTALRITIVLTSDKKVSRIEIGETDEEKNYISYTYSATPAWPSNFKKNDFEPIEQLSLKVIWGTGLGENTFYSDDRYEKYDDDYRTQPDENGYYYYGEEIFLEEMSYYAPKVSGKTPHFYYEKSFVNEVIDYLFIIDNSTVLYVKWK